MSVYCHFTLGLLIASSLQVARAEQDLASPVNPVMGDSLEFTGNTLMKPSNANGHVEASIVGTGFGMYQSNPVQGNQNSMLDVSNAQVLVKKSQGELQFYVQTGYYSIPSLGTSYQRANRQTIDSFGLVPLAYVTFAPIQNWYISAGKLNSIGGYESTFTFQNINIDRGLLWNQTSNVSKGVELNYVDERFSYALSLNDGFYSNQLNWLGGSVSYKASETHTFSASWAGALSASAADTLTTPLLQNNSQIINAIYSYRHDRWSITPYLQYTFVPAKPSVGIFNAAQTKGVAMLVNYSLPLGDMNEEGSSGRVSLPLRLEYISSGGGATEAGKNLLYGPNSAAWSATLTPTYQYKNGFFRTEFSYVQVANSTIGQAFGAVGNSKNQARVMLEFGILY